MKIAIELSYDEEKLLAEQLKPYTNRDDLFDSCMGFISKGKDENVVFKGACVFKGREDGKDSVEYNMSVDSDYFLKHGINGLLEAFKNVEYSNEALEELGYRSVNDMKFK